ncbi:unnamed protein product, partial [Rotaria sordida]
MSTFTLSTSQKNKSLLLSKGFSYIIDKTTIDKTYWKCEHARKRKCKGRVHTDYINTTLLYDNDNHNHSDECEVANGLCDNNATCSHGNPDFGQIICTCKPGYQDVDAGDTVLCVDKCEVANGLCDNNATCSHGNPDFGQIICTCKPGYQDVDAGDTVL